MAISVFIIAVVSYGLSLVDVCGLVSRLCFREEPTGRADYFTLYRRFRWKGVGYALAGDLLRALISVLIGGALMKAAGFPSVGKLLALMFALLGQALPLLPVRDRMVPRQEMIFPALTLLLVDWKVFLVAAVVAVILLALTGNRALMALGAAVMIPVGTIIFGGWWLKIILSLVCAAAILYCNWSEISEAFSSRGKKKSRTAKTADSGGDKDEDEEE